MKIAIPKETWPGEARVAATPDSVKKIKALGVEVVVEAGAGLGADLPDALYAAAGANVVAGAAATLADADIVLKVRRPLAGAAGDELALIRRGALLVAVLDPHGAKDRLADYAAAGVDTLAMELVPRITRAQSMDVLSSQANLAGYKAVIDAASAYRRSFAMMMTAAGTVSPARVFVMGVGVAGLQAIATARRLGAIVSATDVRPAVKEQVKSLGAAFVAVENDEFRAAETAGGYAKQMSEDYQRQQAALIAEHIKKQDVVITTALIPGRRAPVLVTADQVATMRAGSVIVDLAVEQGGNVEGSRPGETVTTANGVRILGLGDLPSRIAADASPLYAKNLLALLQSFTATDGRLSPNWDDEIVKAIALTRDGVVVHPTFAAQGA